MQIAQEVDIPVALPLVWRALNDPGMLRQCLPGCESFESVAENRFEVVITAKLGPVKARFQGELTLSDIQPEKSYLLSGSGKGGVAGFVTGSARVELMAVSDQLTLMKYTVDLAVGGKLAQVGSRLIGAAAGKMAGKFFNSFVRCVSGENPAPPGGNGLDEGVTLREIPPRGGED